MTFKQHQKLFFQFGLSCLIIFVFLLGRRIPLPGLTELALPQVNTTNLSGLIQFHSPSASLFMFGVGPWIVTSIFWGLLFIRTDSPLLSLEKRKQDTYQYLLFLIVSYIQSILFLREAIGFGARMTPLLSLSLVTTLVAGSFVVLWLSNLNAQYGIGGFSIIILVSIFTGFIQSCISFIVGWRSGETSTSFFLGGWGLFLFCIGVATFFNNAEIRLPLNRSSISSQHHDDAYFPIRLTGGNSMPIMYASGIIQFFVTGYNYLATSFQLPWADQVQQVLDLQSVRGLTVYLATIYLLTLLLAPLSLDAKTLAKQMQQAGEYFDYIKPGKMTLLVLKRFLTIQSHLAAIYSVLFVGLPYIINFWFPLPTFYLALPPLVLIIVGLLTDISEHVRMLRINSFYKKYLN